MPGTIIDTQLDFDSQVGNNGDADYTHDSANQLTAADHDYQTDESYTYDDNGNRTNNGHTTGTNNRLTADGTYTYDYDDEGNRTRRTDIATGDDIIEYTWDHRNRLTEVEYIDDSGQSPVTTKLVEYAYDHQNRWVCKTIDPDGDGEQSSTSTYFVYDGADNSLSRRERVGVRASQIVLQFSGSAAADLSHRYLWGPQVDQILADEQVTSLNTAGDVLWPLGDNLNTVRDLAEYNAVLDTTTVVNHRTYDAFGNITSETAPAVNHLFAFTARPFDEDTQLQNNLNRWYDPAVGRWLSEDPIGFDGEDMNLYRYVGNGPLRRTDPSGLACTVTFTCKLTSSSLSDDECTRDCHYTCLETSRILSAGGTITCADLPREKIAGKKMDTQNVSWLCKLCGPRWGSPSGCKGPISDTAVYYDPIVDWGDCSRAKCRGDCDSVLALAKEAAELIRHPALKRATIKAAEVAAVACRDGCNAYCKKP